MRPNKAVPLILLPAIVLVCLHPIAVKATPISASTLRQSAVGEGPFSEESIQPQTPSDSIPSTYNLVQEISTWSDLSVLLGLLSREEDLVTAALSSDPLLVFAPTNDAFLALAQVFLPNTSDDAGTADILSALDQVWTTLSSDIEDLPAIRDVLTYHIVAGDQPEQDISSGSPLDTLNGASLDTSSYPVDIVDLDPTEDSTRLARQIATSNGRVSFIDSVLIPFNVADTLAEAGVTIPLGRQVTDAESDTLFRPFRSLVDFASSRTDLFVLTQLVTLIPSLLEVLTTSPPLHVFAPTDTAFITLVSTLADDSFVENILPEGGENALGNGPELGKFAKRLLQFWDGIPGIPSMEEVIAYHVLNTSSSFSELVGTGPQQTLFTSETFPVDEITIVEGAVQDADETVDSQLIASFATRNGFVSVIDTVLIPFTIEAGQEAFPQLVNPDRPPLPSPSGSPQPSASPAPFSAAALQPSIPDQSILSAYNLVDELLAWSDLSVLVTLVSNTTLLAEALSPDPLLVFAPTDDAFLSTARLFLSDLPEDPTTDEIVSAMNGIWDNLSSEIADLPSLQDLLSYHLVARDLPEQQIASIRSLESVFGSPLRTSQYPRLIFDANPGRNAKRLGRQISTSNGRISFINNVLFPFNVSEALESAGVMLPLNRQEMDDDMIDDVFKPFRSLVDFVTSRNDLIVLTRLVSGSENLQSVLSNTPTPLHVFAPTDSAFIALFRALVPEEAVDSPFAVAEDIETILRDRTALEAFADQLSTLWALVATVEGVPTLEQVVAYHVLNTTRSFDELVGTGPQDTLFSSEEFGVNEITVVEGAVQDADSTGNSELIASFVTGNGFVSVVEGVLLPFTLDAGREAVLEVLTIPTAEPTPDTATIPTAEPTPDTATRPTPSPDSESDGDDNGEDDDPVCFPSIARLQLANGTYVQMRELEAGHSVHVGDGTVSPVFLFTHKQADIVRPFTRITTRSGHEVTLTPSHYLYANGQLTAAKAVRVGDILDTVDGKSVVEKTELLKLSGLYAPHTLHGDMMVDGVRVSGYSMALHPRFAHALLSPIRLFVRLTAVREPLGGLFYGGAEHIARILPSGGYRY